MTPHKNSIIINDMPLFLHSKSRTKSWKSWVNRLTYGSSHHSH